MPEVWLGAARFSLAFAIPILLLELAAPQPALAFQSHGYPELYAHQLAHIFFLLAMLSFTFRIHRCGLIEQRQWQWFSRGAWWLAFWNIWAFIGHVLEQSVPADHIRLLGADQVPSLAITSWQEVAYFLLQMDHLICVPALVCFCVGFKIMLNPKPLNP